MCYPVWLYGLVFYNRVYTMVLYYCMCVHGVVYSSGGLMLLLVSLIFLSVLVCYLMCCYGLFCHVFVMLSCVVSGWLFCGVMLDVLG